MLVLMLALLFFTLFLRWSLRYDHDHVHVHVDQLPTVIPTSTPPPPSPAPAPAPASAPAYECAVCCSFTSTRCSRCKAVRYCSSKCQIMHWRQGHKYDCHPSPITLFDATQQPTHSDIPNVMPRLSTVTAKSIPSPEIQTPLLDTDHSMHTHTMKPGDANIQINFNSPQGSISSDVHHHESQDPIDVHLLQSEGHEYPQSSKHNAFNSFPGTDNGKHPLQSKIRGSSGRLPHLGLKTSLQKVVHTFKTPHYNKSPHQYSPHDPSENHNHKAICQYDTFLKLYSCNDVELKPFGIINCGNSCYANAVLQCLAYTRPLTLYLLERLHSKECWKEEWCFICEFEHLVQKASEGFTPLSAIRILSNISHLGHGREEDAHEFLRYAVDTMQSVCIQLSRSVGPVVEDATLVSMTFGGYLHSKIKCLKCHHKSEMYERMMDLTVEIDGDIRSLEQALRRFTAYEMLEGKNKYHCSRCKSYEKAKKKLSVFQAPNILTIVLKRFQAGTFRKLDKLVQFPQNLDMAPFMSRSSDGYPHYRLYAVVVHLDLKSAAICGHYVCYVKDYHGEWFKIDDSVVSRVDLESVLSEEAYILLYARQSPRPKATSKDVSDRKLRDAFLHAVPTRRSGKSGIPKATQFSDPLAMQYQSSRKGYAKDSPYLEEWVTHSVESIPRVDSLSEASSLFSNSELGTCSTPSTKESTSVEDFTDNFFSSVR